MGGGSTKTVKKFIGYAFQSSMVDTEVKKF
jgi:hypothetical protein